MNLDFNEKLVCEKMLQLLGLACFDGEYHHVGVGPGPYNILVKKSSRQKLNYLFTRDYYCHLAMIWLPVPISYLP